MPKIRFLPVETEVEVAEGTTILDAALDHNVPLNHNCGGNCACSTCHVVVEQGFESLGEISDDEAEMLEEATGLTELSRLACQCQVSRDLVVRIPEPDVSRVKLIPNTILGT
jgi:2Fe-2S ferredoxin